MDNYLKAGKIAKQAKEYARSLVKEGVNFLYISEKVEAKIVSLGGKPAFPVDVSVNEIAAHYSPVYGDKSVIVKGDLVKIDIGVHIDGCIADTAFSVSIGNSEENEKLIRAAEDALAVAKKEVGVGVEVSEIGRAVQEKISSHNVQVIRNLTGHSLGEYEVHGGLSIPNFDSGNKTKLKEGDVIAIEPFSTNGEGRVIESKGSQIYALIANGKLRQGRDVLKFIEEEYKTLPFCKRWLIKKFGLLKASTTIHQMLSQKMIKEYPILREKAGGKVGQAEDTMIVGKTVEVIT